MPLGLNFERLTSMKGKVVNGNALHILNTTAATITNWEKDQNAKADRLVKEGSTMEFEALWTDLNNAIIYFRVKCEEGELTEAEKEFIRTEFQWAFDALIRDNLGSAQLHVNRANARMN